jgi:hypothetical protein
MTDGKPPDSAIAQDHAAEVSFMITLAQKQRLRALGHDEAAISAMTPQQAHRILRLQPIQPDPKIR